MEVWDFIKSFPTWEEAIERDPNALIEKFTSGVFLRNEQQQRLEYLCPNPMCWDFPREMEKAKAIAGWISFELLVKAKSNYLVIWKEFLLRLSRDRRIRR